MRGTSPDAVPPEALNFDALVTSWSELVRLAERPQMGQGELVPPGTVGG